MSALCAILLFAMASTNAGASRREIVEGNPASTVRVLIYDDLQCPDCLRLRTLLDQKVLPRYGTRVAFVHRDFPLPKHDWARQAAIAGRWVSEQSPVAGIIFRREILSEQNNITPLTLKPWLAEFASRNKLNPKAIVDSLADNRLTALVDQDYLGGVARGVARTPTIYVGNQQLVETILYEDLARLLDVELGR